MKKRLLNVYNCDYCNKLYLVKPAMIRHESYCASNPENWPACQTCTKLRVITKVIVVNEGTYNEYEREVKSFHCDLKNIGLYPAKALRKDLLRKYPENFVGEELMPKECELHTTEIDPNDPDSLPF